MTSRERAEKLVQAIHERGCDGRAIDDIERAIADAEREAFVIAMKEEREACAAIVDRWRTFEDSEDMADAIRNRGRQ
jgi:vacuolar-type H+-ATPase subunit E/Vma4